MKIFCVISIMIFFCSIIALFKVKLHFQELNRELIKVKHEIKLAESEIKVLQAEWSYLNSPKRIALLMEKYLRNHSLVSVNKIKRIQNLPQN
ncbi:cell division protein FtsL [Wolbachia endosymbiont of Chironomus riparius]|uniref:cell division protein FtsL n=1 Tax=Wolbachia endosymbiont of Chironomus riparius TaxID=2883238 RepID=UPI0020A17F34|nr:hypothetical protein [Wolbachia endosymbiont of Chironomus riparius]